jgi:signal transduction histidine kinase
VGALRGDTTSVSERLEALVAEYRAGGEGTAELRIEGEPQRLQAATAEAVVRVVQESLTNVRKHARGADVSVRLQVSEPPGDEVVLVVADENAQAPETAGTGAGSLAGTGGGYGLQGMRERAQLLGGTLTAGVNGRGWRVELRLPVQAERTERTR